MPADLLSNPSRYLDAWVGMPGTAALADAVRYTNRGPPPAWANGSLALYGAALGELTRQLSAAGVAPRVRYEVGNEPDALLYFWGKAAEFEPIADAVHRALLPAGGAQGAAPGAAPVACCAFTTDLSGYNDPGSPKLGFRDWARASAARYPGGALSWHFYRHSSNDGNANISTCGHRHLGTGTCLVTPPRRPERAHLALPHTGTPTSPPFTARPSRARSSPSGGSTPTSRRARRRSRPRPS